MYTDIYIYIMICVYIYIYVCISVFVYRGVWTCKQNNPITAGNEETQLDQPLVKRNKMIDPGSKRGIKRGRLELLEAAR